MSELIIDKITTRDGSNVGAIVVADIDELLLLNTNKEINTTAIVKDNNRGGVFVYDATQSGVNNGGTIFNGWVRQYDGAVNVKWFGAKGDGITDDTDAFLGALSLGAIILELQPKTYSFSQELLINKDITLNGNGAKLIGTTAAARVRVLGALQDEIAITAPIASGAGAITATNTFNKHDIIIIRDDTDYSYGQHRSYYKVGEYVKVTSTTGSVFNIEGGTRRGYSDITNLKASRLLPLRVTISDLTIVNLNATDYVLGLYYVKDSVISNCTIEGGTLRAAVINKSYNVSVTDSEFEHEIDPTTGYNYGLSVNNSHAITVSRCKIHGSRHATGIGGDNENGAVQNYMLHFYDCLLSNSVASNLYVADIHGNSENTTYSGCDIQGAIAVAGENTTYINNSIYLLTDRPAIDLTEVIGGEMRIEGNIVDVTGNSGTYNKVINGSSSSFSEDITYDVTYVVKNNVFALSSKIDYLILLYKAAGIVNAAVLNLIYENNRFRNDCSGLVSIVKSYNYDYVTKKQEFITIKDFHRHASMPSNVQIFVKAAGTVTGTLLTLPKIGYTKTVSTAVGDYAKTIYFTFPFDYGTYKPGYRAALRNCSVNGSTYPFVELNGTAVGVNVTVTSGNTGETFGGARDWEVSLEFGGSEILA